MRETDAQIELRIARIADPETSADEIAETINLIDYAMERAKAMKMAGEKNIEQRLLAVESTMPPPIPGKRRKYATLVCGKWEWVLKHPKETFERDLEKAVEGMLDACGGDIKTFCQMLCSKPLKPGACRQQINNEEEFDRLFQTVEKNDVERKLVKQNLEFVKPKTLKGASHV